MKMTGQRGGVRRVTVLTACLLWAGLAQAAVPNNVKGPLRAQMVAMEKACQAHQWADCHLMRFTIESQKVAVPDEIEGERYEFRHNIPATNAYGDISQKLFAQFRAKPGVYDQYILDIAPLPHATSGETGATLFDPDRESGNAYDFYDYEALQAHLKARGVHYPVERMAFKDKKLELLRMAAIGYAIRGDYATTYRALVLLRERIRRGTPNDKGMEALKLALATYLKRH